MFPSINSICVYFDYKGKRQNYPEYFSFVLMRIDLTEEFLKTIFITQNWNTQENRCETLISEDTTRGGLT